MRVAHIEKFNNQQMGVTARGYCARRVLKLTKNPEWPNN